MLKSKSKGLFVDISELSIIAVRTSGYEFPMVVEKVADFTIKDNFRPEEVRDFLGELVDLKKMSNYPARCGVCPQGRFIRYHEVESAAKLKNKSFVQKLLQSELDLNPETDSVSILNAHDGSHFDVTKNVTNQLIFCGAPTKALQEKQDQILSYGLFPERLELSSVATLGGICNYLRLNDFESPIMCIELTANDTHIIIINKNKVEMIRSLAFGLDSLFPVLQEEMGLQDEASARKLFHSNTFDVGEMGRKLLQKILKELQAVSGYYEVQTGFTIERFFTSLLPAKLSWIPNTISNNLGLELVQIDLGSWLQSLDIKTDEGVDLSALEARWLSVFSLMGEFGTTEKVTV